MHPYREIPLILTTIWELILFYSNEQINFISFKGVLINLEDFYLNALRKTSGWNKSLKLITSSKSDPYLLLSTHFLREIALLLNPFNHIIGYSGPSHYWFHLDGTFCIRISNPT